MKYQNLARLPRETKARNQHTSTMKSLLTRIIRRRPATLTLLALIGLGCLMSPLEVPAAEAITKTWTGTWDNKKFKTSGPLTCTATAKDSANWQAKFTGTGLGKPFGYDAAIKIANRSGRLTLAGTTTVDGETYQWSGYVAGKSLIGSYRSATGNNGTFRLEETK